MTKFWEDSRDKRGGDSDDPVAPAAWATYPSP